MKQVLTIWLFWFSASQLLAQGREVRRYYDSDREVIKERYFVKDNDPSVLYGNYESYYYDGTVKSRGQYVNNETFGFWEYYYENGKLKMAGRLVNGINQGVWSYYFENGNLSMQGNVYDGVRQDKWQLYYENGTLKSEGKYKNDEKTGLWTYYYEDGRRKAQSLYKEEMAIYKEYFASGKLKAQGFLVEGKSDSIWVSYYESGVIKSKGNYKEGVRDGYWQYFYPNGNVHSEGNYSEGVTEGKWTYYHEQGKISSEGAERDGRKEGYWKLYYDNGNLKGEGVFKAGQGEFSEFYESGKLKAKGIIKDGLNEGEWLYYYESGELEGKCDFTSGEGDYIGYYPNGAVKLKGRIEDNQKVGTWELYDENTKLVGYYKPVYEEEPSFFTAASTKEMRLFTNADFEKPEYLFRSRQTNYFTKRLNEYKGVIIETNPLYTILGAFPLSIEYYLQERMGVQFLIAFLRKPFFGRSSGVEENELFHNGAFISLRHKFYHKDRELGMPYFAYDLSYSYRRMGENFEGETAYMNRNKLSIGLTGGSRWQFLPDDKGFSLDIYAGIGLGYKLHGNIDTDSQQSGFVSLIEQNDAFFLEPRLGFMLGYNFSLTKKKSRTQ